MSKLTIDTANLTPEQLQALAILSGKSTIKPTSYKVGDKVAGGIVDKVYPDHARIKFEGGKMLDGVKVFQAYTTK